MVEDVVKKLLAWAEASRKLGVARSKYEGEKFQEDNKDLISEVLKAKEDFDTAFLKFVDLLVACC